MLSVISIGIVLIAQAVAIKNLFVSIGLATINDNLLILSSIESGIGSILDSNIESPTFKFYEFHR